MQVFSLRAARRGDKKDIIVTLFVDRIWDIGGSNYDIPKAIFYLLKGGY